MYTLIELASGYLPWEEEDDKIEIERMKQETPISVLLKVGLFANLCFYSICCSIARRVLRSC